MFVKTLGPDYANFINDNWKFKSDASFLWIQSQCQSNMAFGIFPSLDSESKKCSKIWKKYWQFEEITLISSKC